MIRNGKTGLLFLLAGNIKLLSENIERILIDDELRIRIQKEGYQWVREIHRWDKTTEVYKDIYEKEFRN